MTALVLRGVSKSFGRTRILHDVNLSIEPGEHHAIIGPNGAGKSTLFNVISGRMAPSSGEILLHDVPIAGMAPHLVVRQGLARSFQITNLFPRLSVFENIRCALLHARGYGLSFWHLLGRAREFTSEVERLMTEIGLAHRAGDPAGALSYAEQRVLEIGVTVAGNPSVILLDEPTAGMSRAEAENTVALIRRVVGDRTLVMVEHDMAVVFELAERVSVMVEGTVLASGPPAEIRANAAVQAAYLGQIPVDVT